MKFRIYGTSLDGTEDSIVVEGETLEDIRKEAKDAVDLRDWQNPWSEQLEG